MPTTVVTLNADTDLGRLPGLAADVLAALAALAEAREELPRAVRDSVSWQFVLHTPGHTYSADCPAVVYPPTTGMNPGLSPAELADPGTEPRSAAALRVTQAAVKS